MRFVHCARGKSFIMFQQYIIVHYSPAGYLQNIEGELRILKNHIYIVKKTPCDHQSFRTRDS